MCGDFHMCAVADFVGVDTNDEPVQHINRQRSISSIQNSDSDRVRLMTAKMRNETLTLLYSLGVELGLERLWPVRSRKPGGPILP